MSGIITHKFQLNNARQFFESFTEDSTINSRYYVFLARAHPWSSDANPPTPVDSVIASSYNVWRNMIIAKRVSASDVSHVASKYLWTSGNVYTPYTDSNGSLYSSQFYVITDTYNVYKCIDNNGGALSTVKPTHTDTGIITELTDGYRWKFMYTVTAGDQLKFGTTNFIPTKKLESNDGSIQWTVQQAAVNGAIEFVKTDNGGSGYLGTIGTLDSVTDSTTVVLENTTAAAGEVSTTDDAYSNSVIYITGGTGAGQLRNITNYEGSTRTVTVDSAFSPVLDTTSTYNIGPKVNIGGDGRDFSAYANVAFPCSLSSGSALNKVIIINRGANYSKVKPAITSNTSHGVGALISASIPPIGGHGSDPVNELNAKNVTLNVRISGNESGTIVANNDFRIVGVLKDPLLLNGSRADGTVYDLTTKITVSTKSGSYDPDEHLVSNTSVSLSRFVSFANTNTGGTTGVIRTVGLDGEYQTGELLTGNTSAVTSVIESIESRPFINFKGEVLYVENRLPVSRSFDQTEDVKLIVRF